MLRLMGAEIITVSAGILHLSLKSLKDYHDKKKKSVLMHELTHAIFFEAGFKQQEEDVIDRVSKILLQVIEDNDLKKILNTLESEGE